MGISRHPLLAVVVALTFGGSAPASHATECPGARPGAVMVVPLVQPLDPRPYPTFGFMFYGSDGHRYATTAGHVALGTDLGERTWTDGVVIRTIEGDRVGTFVYAINTRATPPPDGLPPGADLALIRVDDGVSTDARVCGIGGPTGIDGRVLPSAEPVEHRWFGATAIGGRVGHPAPAEGPWIAPARSGFSLGMPSAYAVSVAGHASFGDSGAPVLTSDGGAVGWISGPPNGSEGTGPGTFVVTRIGPAIARAAEVLGITLTLATA